MYSYKGNEHSARALGRSLPISRKHAIEIANHVRNKKLSFAKQYLSDVIAMKRPVEFTRFNWNMGHKRQTAMAGRYPVKAASHVLAIIKAAESNADAKGLSTEDLVVAHISAKQGPNTWRYGRHSRRQAKRTHVEVVVEEKKGEALKAKPSSSKKRADKAEAKPSAPQKQEEPAAKPSTPAASTQSSEKKSEEPSQTTEKKQ